MSSFQGYRYRGPATHCGVENLYVIFLDLKKAFYLLDRDRTMAILEGYGVGKNLLAFIKGIYGYGRFMLMSGARTMIERKMTYAVIM
jgi:hypothetical protein